MLTEKGGLAVVQFVMSAASIQTMFAVEMPNWLREAIDKQ